MGEEGGESLRRQTVPGSCVIITFLTLALGQSAERELTGKALTVTNEFNISSSSSMKNKAPPLRV